MIVRDEADCLERCLASVEGVVDEVCVLDTGSTDATAEIARAHGARVEPFAWCDDFAAARNASLASASGDWILVLDADEELASQDARARLEAFARQHPDHAGRVWMVDRSEREEGGRREPLTRFFPRSAEPRYAGTIHEQLTFDGRTPPRAATGVEVWHFGYSDERIAAKDKLARNERLLLAALREHPRDAYLLYQLGRNQARAGNPRAALEAFGRAFDTVEPDDPFLPGLVQATGYGLRQIGQWEQAYELFTRVGAAFVDDPEMCFLGALLAMDVGHLDLAETGFQRCLEMGQADGRQQAATCYGAAYNLGVMSEVLARTEEARAYYERALALRPDHGPSREGLARLARTSAE